MTDADHDSVSSDSGRGPSEEEFRANSLRQQQLPHCRLHNGPLALTLYSPDAIIVPHQII